MEGFRRFLALLSVMMMSVSYADIYFAVDSVKDKSISETIDVSANQTLIVNVIVKEKEAAICQCTVSSNIPGHKAQVYKLQYPGMTRVELQNQTDSKVQYTINCSIPVTTSFGDAPASKQLRGHHRRTSSIAGGAIAASSSAPFKGNWTNTFKCKNGIQVTHTPDGIEMLDLSGNSLKGASGISYGCDTYGGLKLKQSIKLKTDSTRDEFIKALINCGLLSGKGKTSGYQN